MSLLHTFTNSLGEIEVVPYPIWCDNVIMRCRVLTDCIGIKGIDRIWPLKQRAVRDLYNHCVTDSNLTELWIFGSATQERCNLDSDLDIAYRHADNADAFRLFASSVDANGVDLIDLDTVAEFSRLWIQIHKGVRLI